MRQGDSITRGHSLTRELAEEILRIEPRPTRVADPTPDNRYGYRFVGDFDDGRRKYVFEGDGETKPDDWRKRLREVCERCREPFDPTKPSIGAPPASRRLCDTCGPAGQVRHPLP